MMEYFDPFKTWSYGSDMQCDMAGHCSPGDLQLLPLDIIATTSDCLDTEMSDNRNGDESNPFDSEWNLPDYDFKDISFDASPTSVAYRVVEYADGQTGGESPVDACSEAFQTGGVLADREVPMTQKSKSSRFTSMQISQLRSWFDLHADDPYPNDTELRLLCDQTQLKTKQVRDWFSRARQKLWGADLQSTGGDSSLVVAAAATPRSSGTRSDWGSTGSISESFDELNKASLEGLSTAPTDVASWLINVYSQQRLEAAQLQPVDSLAQHLEFQSPIPSEECHPHSRRPSSELFDVAFQVQNYINDRKLKRELNPRFGVKKTGNRRYGRSSNMSSASSVAESASSANSAQSLLSVNSNTSRASRRGRRLRLPTLPALADPLYRRPSRKRRGSENMHYCTFCGKSFRSKFTWRRHEESVCVPCKTWTCGLQQHDLLLRDTEPLNVTGCEYLETNFCPQCYYRPSAQHCIHSDSFQSCWAHPELERTFYRKDAFIQHLTRVHKLSYTPFINCYGKSTLPTGPLLLCRFCGLQCKDWDERVDHVSQHFKDGREIWEWHDYCGPKSDLSSKEEQSIANDNEASWGLEYGLRYVPNSYYSTEF